jgi:hypothetical protein
MTVIALRLRPAFARRGPESSLTAALPACWRWALETRRAYAAHGVAALPDALARAPGPGGTRTKTAVRLTPAERRGSPR